MKIKEVQAGVKLTKNYDSYQASLVAEIETGENPEEVGEALMEKALVIVSKKLELKKRPTLDEPSEIEIGAAWFDKKSKEKLSVKYSKDGKWKNMNIEDLEKIKDGYRQKTGEGIFIFRKIPDEKRMNYKMPAFRIYKLEENN